MPVSRIRKNASDDALSHLDERGNAHMVDVGQKDVTERTAIATATVRMQRSTLKRIVTGQMPKGEVLAVARIAGIMAAKRTSELIPLCHPLLINHASVEFTPGRAGTLDVRATVRVSGKTGVEMEALTAVSVAALTVYDMCKAVDRGMTVTDLGLLEKSGGRSGVWTRPPVAPKGLSKGRRR